MRALGPPVSPGRGHDVILYDGVCGVCNRLVAWVLPRDRRARFRFATLQSAFARDVLARHGRDAGDLDAVHVLVAAGRGGERLLRKSRAILHVLWRLGGVWRLGALLAPCPTWLLDAAYDAFARYRYGILGRSERCALPAAGWCDRFIEV